MNRAKETNVYKQGEMEIEGEIQGNHNKHNILCMYMDIRDQETKYTASVSSKTNLNSDLTIFDIRVPYIEESCESNNTIRIYKYLQTATIHNEGHRSNKLLSIC